MSDAILKVLRKSDVELNGREIMQKGDISRWFLYSKLADLERKGLIVGRTPSGEGRYPGTRPMRLYRAAK